MAELGAFFPMHFLPRLPDDIFAFRVSISTTAAYTLCDVVITLKYSTWLTVT